LSVGEYYFFEMEEELTPFVRDGAEVEEAGWFALDDLKKMSCNVDVNYFIERVLRKRGVKRPPVPPPRCDALLAEDIPL
jgi:hypothetical protein